MTEKDQLVEAILVRQLGEYFEWHPSEAKPFLGQAYAAELGVLADATQAFVFRQREIMQFQDFDDLTSQYDVEGNALTKDLRDYWAEVRTSSPISARTHDVLLAGLGKPSLLPDYSYWSRMEWFELKEVMWLIIGLNPKIDWTEKLKPSGRKKTGHPSAFKFAEDLHR